MKSLVVLMLAASGLGLLCFAKDGPEQWPVREQQTIQKTFVLAAAPMRLVVENVFGYVHVTVGSGSEVRLTAHKTIRAESDNDLQQARQEVNLDTSEKPGTIEIAYDAPGDCRNGRGDCQEHHHERRFYEVTYDLDLEVPRATKPYVSTVNRGDIRIDGTNGDFEVRNVNGRIDLANLGGAGSVKTVNGTISAHFNKAPLAATSFSTVNGDVDTYFPAGVSADLKFKTFHGEIYSDFDVTPMVLPQTQGEREGARFVYKSNGMRGARVGRGGPEISFNTLNGSIRLHRAS